MSIARSLKTSPPCERELKGILNILLWTEMLSLFSKSHYDYANLLWKEKKKENTARQRPK